MDPDDREDAHDPLLRLLRENAEHDPGILESSRKAIDESRRLLEKVARDHPDVA